MDVESTQSSDDEYSGDDKAVRDEKSDHTNTIGKVTEQIDQGWAWVILAGKCSI